MSAPIIKASFVLLSMAGFLALTQPRNILKLALNTGKLVTKKNIEEKK